MIHYNIFAHYRKTKTNARGWKLVATVQAANDSAAIGLARLQGLVPESTPVKAVVRPKPKAKQ